MAILDFIKEVLYSEKKVEEAMESIVSNILFYYQNKEVIVLTVLDGGKYLSDYVFSNGLPDKMFKNVYISASSYFNNKKILNININIPDMIDFKDKNVLVLDDIYDSGETLNSICLKIIALGAKEVNCAVLVKKRRDRRSHYAPVFSWGLEVENDDFLVGCGMDYNGEYRKLPYIASVKELE